MNCSNCGAAIVAGSRFCGDCGTPIDATARGTSQPPARSGTASRGSDAFARTMVAPSPTFQTPVAPVAPGAHAASSPPSAHATAAAKPNPAATLVAHGPVPAVPHQAPAPQVAPAARVPPPKTAFPGAVPAGGSATEHAVSAPIGKRDLVGTTLNGRYLVKDRIGEGGFGAVYRGEQLAMGRECAIKVLHGRMARDPQIVGRFKREAQAASVLRAVHTVAIYDFDQTPEGVLYLAMELLHGTSLHEAMQQQLMPAERVAHILDGIADSLGEAHSHGIVHRDIKPENVFLESRNGDPDFVKVLDFGIAKIVSGSEDKSGPQLTAAGQTLGTIEYMSPEQLMGQPLDGRSDLYALGNLAYELLCGHLPFGTLRTPGDQITAHLKTLPPTPSKAHPELRIPPLVDEIILKLLQKHRDNRYKDAAELQLALRKVPAAVAAQAAGAPLTASAPKDAAPAARVARIDPDASTHRDLHPLDKQPPSIVARSGSNRVYVAAGVVFLLIALAAAIMLLGRTAGASEPPPPARMVPSSCEGIFSADLRRLRAGTPAAAIDPILSLLRPQLLTVGADPEKAGRLAVGLSSASDKPAPAFGKKRKSSASGLDSLGEAPAEGAVVIVDLPVDQKKFEAALANKLRPGERYQTSTYKGVKLHKGPLGEYAFLSGERVLLASGATVSGSIDLSQGMSQGAGKTTPLVDGAPAGLLERAGAKAGGGPAAFAWAKLSDRHRRQIDHYMPGTSSVEELAGSFNLGPTGAQLKAAGRCSSAEGAAKTVAATRAALERARHDTLLALAGLRGLPEAVRVTSDGAFVDWTLNLSPAQYADVATKLSMIVAAAMQSMMPPASTEQADARAAASGHGAAPAAP